ncbi:Tryptophan--tRNA ligase, mitochondrial [Dissophora globulifera]|nr:Tryptophan--tRNA ligase, mitochondrial [Dissophora globulifera]
MTLAARSLASVRQILTRAQGRELCKFNGTRSLATQSTRTKPKEKPIIFSGIQPTGQPHLGNYLGAISNWVTLQEQAHHDNETLIFSIVDLHAITLPQDPKKLRKERHEMAATLLACGIDPKKCILFEQSRSKLGVTKGVKSLDDVSATAGLQLGLFAYPVLMAADILLYKATKIPVGEDQIQHLELARDIAQMFNKTVKTPFFPLPRPMITETKRVMSLRDPSRKMSKSDPSDQTRINLADSPDVIAAKIKRAATDSIQGISYDREERPAVANLVDIYAAMKRISVDDVVKEHAQSSNAVFKEGLTEVVVSRLRPIQEEMARLEKEEGYVQSILHQGATKATELSQPNMKEIHRLMGLS